MVDQAFAWSQTTSCVGEGFCGEGCMLYSLTYILSWPAASDLMLHHCWRIKGDIFSFLLRQCNIWSCWSWQLKELNQPGSKEGDVWKLLCQREQFTVELRCTIYQFNIFQVATELSFFNMTEEKIIKYMRCDQSNCFINLTIIRFKPH